MTLFFRYPLHMLQCNGFTDVIVIVQVNGKKRGELEIDTNLSENDILDKALKLESVNKQKASKDLKKTIYIKNKIINLVL